MSWFKEMFGMRSIGHSTASKDSFEEVPKIQDNYCQGQMRKFLSQKETLRTNILGYEIVSDVVISLPQKKYVQYTINVQALGQEYSVGRRYSAFKELHEHATKNYKGYNIPNFPSSTSFH